MAFHLIARARLVSLPAMALLASWPAPAAAHHPVASGAWNAEPWIVLPLAAAVLLYALGVSRLWRKAGAGRGVTRAQVARFAAGWIALAGALVSPIDALGGALFSAHMVQHELLMVVAAPLLVTARPIEVWTWALAPRWRRLLGDAFHARGWRATWGGLTDPAVAWVLHAVALWAWHVPALFEASLAHEGVHAAQHASFFATALAFWWTVVGRGLAHAGGPALASVFTTMLHTGALGALLTFAPSPWYAHYAGAAAWGLTPLEDQQLGGLVMWVPGGLAYLAAGLAIVAAWLAPARAVQPVR